MTDFLQNKHERVAQHQFRCLKQEKCRFLSPYNARKTIWGSFHFPPPPIGQVSQKKKKFLQKADRGKGEEMEKDFFFVYFIPREIRLLSPLLGNPSFSRMGEGGRSRKWPSLMHPSLFFSCPLSSDPPAGGGSEGDLELEGVAVSHVRRVGPPHTPPPTPNEREGKFSAPAVLHIFP